VGSTALLHPFPGTHPDQVSFEPATIANTLSNNRPTGSVGSWIEPLSLSWMFRLSTRPNAASIKQRPRERSSLVTTKVSPAR
jgi:hypothetical protein